jgi:hypothetical protein
MPGVVGRRRASPIDTAHLAVWLDLYIRLFARDKLLLAQYRALEQLRSAMVAARPPEAPRYGPET